MRRQGRTFWRGRIPNLVLNPDERDRVKRHLDRYPWYRSIYQVFVQQVDKLLEKDPVIPLEKGRAFYDSCPNDHTQLIFDPYEPKTHICPKCNKNWSDEWFDGAWIRQFQGWLAKRLIEAGIIYQLSGEERYAAYVQKVLEHFCLHYYDYPLSNNLLGPTRIFQSTFLEAFWLLDMVVAYDLVREVPCFKEADHAAIKRLFYESCNTIRSFDEGVSNRQAFNNAGMGAVGFLYNDEDIIHHVLEGPHGLAFHLRESLLEDGLWYEGETYHFATLDHLLDLAELARHRSTDLYAQLRPMFDGPLKVIYPDLTFPSRKDSWFGRGIFYHREIYELGYARYGDGRFGGLLARAYAQEGARREPSWRGFLYLNPELPELDLEVLRPKQGEAMPGTGVAILRGNEGNSYVSTEYGHYGGGHGHPDRLHLNFFADGYLWFLDPGTGWYHEKEMGWYRSSLAHNTVVVDGASQNPAEGRLVTFGDSGGFQVAQASVENAYPGVTMRRTLCLSEHYLFDCFDLSSDEPHIYDWALHTRAHVEKQVGVDLSKEEARQELGGRAGYEFLGEVRRLHESCLDMTFTAQSKKLRVLQLSSSRLYTAKSLGIPLHEDIPFTTVIARCSGTSIRYVTCYLHTEAATTARLTEEDGHYQLELGQETHHLSIGEPAGVSVTVMREGDLQTIAWFNQQNVDAHLVSLQTGKRLPYGSFRRARATWLADLPPDFGRVSIQGQASPDELIQGLPEGASIAFKEGTLEITQAAKTAIWLADNQATLELAAGCTNNIRFFVANYGADNAQIPTLHIPPAWKVQKLECLANDSPRLWRATVAVPTHVTKTEGSMGISLAAETASFPYVITAPIRTSWTVASIEGQPVIELQVKDLWGQGGHVHGDIVAPWLSERTQVVSLQLEPYASQIVRLPLPLKAPAPETLHARVNPQEQGWTLLGTEDNSGDYLVRANLQIEGFMGTSEARFPLYWSTARGTRATALTLARADQAYWAEEPWGGLNDASAKAILQWDEHGLWLQCEVLDDKHVADGNKEDLFENDSLQIFFDFRPPPLRDSNFTPGVAAFILAADKDKQRVQVQQIPGNKEQANRTARAEWFSSEGIQATILPKPEGYDLEVFFPYRSLNVPPLKPGDVIGFDSALNDNDGTWYRTAQLVWSGARGGRCYLRWAYHNPLEYGFVIAARAGPEA